MTDRVACRFLAAAALTALCVSVRAEEARPASGPGPWIRVNQIGYLPDDPKIAVLSSDQPLSGEFDVAHLAYSNFRSVLAQEPTIDQIIPVKPAAANDAAPVSAAAVEYEPDEEDILAALLPRNVAVQIYRALLENQAGFYGSQMNAMDNATRNAGDMIRRLSIQYNRTRQAAITTELVEIISGAEAL